MIDPQTVTTSLSMLPSLEKAGTVPHKIPSSVLKVTWNPSVEQLATYDDQKLILWQLAEGQPMVNDRLGWPTTGVHVRMQNVLLKYYIHICSRAEMSCVSHMIIM